MDLCIYCLPFFYTATDARCTKQRYGFNKKADYTWQKVVSGFSFYRKAVIARELLSLLMFMEIITFLYIFICKGKF